MTLHLAGVYLRLLAAAPPEHGAQQAKNGGDREQRQADQLHAL
jgi:hypothetical protein